MVLPNELLSHIFSFVENRRHLWTLCLVSRAFLPAAEREIHRKLALRNPVTTIRLCLLLLRKPHLARYTRSLDLLYLFNYPDGGQGAWRALNVPGYTRLLFRALQQMTQLQSLAYMSHRAPPCGQLNLSLCRFALTSFRIVILGDLALQFFDQQPTLKKLFIMVISPNHDYFEIVRRCTLSSISQLHSISAHWKVVTMITPNRPVETAKVLFEVDLDDLRRGLPHLSLSTGPLKAFRLPMRSFSLEVFHLLASHLINLEKLILDITDYDSLQTMAQCAANESANAIRIPTFGHLTDLILVARVWQSLIEIDFGPLVSRLGHSCSTLTMVTFCRTLEEDDISHASVDVRYKRTVLRKVPGISNEWRRELSMERTTTGLYDFM